MPPQARSHTAGGHTTQNCSNDPRHHTPGHEPPPDPRSLHKSHLAENQPLAAEPPPASLAPTQPLPDRSFPRPLDRARVPGEPHHRCRMQRPPVDPRTRRRRSRPRSLVDQIPLPEGPRPALLGAIRIDAAQGFPGHARPIQKHAVPAIGRQSLHERHTTIGHLRVSLQEVVLTNTKPRGQRHNLPHVDHHRPGHARATVPAHRAGKPQTIFNTPPPIRIRKAERSRLIPRITVRAHASTPAAESNVGNAARIVGSYRKATIVWSSSRVRSRVCSYKAPCTESTTQAG